MLAWGDLEHPNACVNFFPPVNSVSWWQAAFEWVVFSVLLTFHWRKMTGAAQKQLCVEISRDMLDPINSDPDFINTMITGDESCVYGYDPETKLFHHFPYNENLMRALNTTSLKCCLPSTDRRERIHVCIWRVKVASCKCVSLKSIKFSQKKFQYLNLRVP